MSITINGTTNTITAASGVTIAGNTAVTGTLSVSSYFYANGGAAADASNAAIRVTNNRIVTFTDSVGATTNCAFLFCDTSNNLNIGAGNNTRLQLTSAGVVSLLNGQLKFPATQSASADANTLDDYEEGTWTPTIVGLGTAGAGTYSVQVGAYTKVGNKVTVTAFLTWSAHTGTGAMYIGALPFTPKNTANQLYAASVYINNMTLTASNVPQAYINANETAIYLNQVPVGGGAAASIDMDTAASVIATAAYFV